MVWMQVPERDDGETVLVRKLNASDLTPEKVMHACISPLELVSLDEPLSNFTGRNGDQWRFRCGCLQDCITCSSQYAILGLDYCCYMCTRRWLSRHGEAAQVACDGSSSSVSDWTGTGLSSSEASAETGLTPRHTRIRKRRARTFSKRFSSRTNHHRAYHPRPLIT